MAKRNRDPNAKIRRAIGAKPHDVIEHLLVDAPPCEPYVEPADETVPRSPLAAAFARTLELLEGDLIMDFNDSSAAAILELGGVIVAYPDSSTPATAWLLAKLPRGHDQIGDRIWARCWDPLFYVEPRDIAEQRAKANHPAYRGVFDDPAPPDSEFEIAERAMVLAAEAEERATAAAAEAREAAQRAVAARDAANTNKEAA